MIGNVFASAIPDSITQHLARDELSPMLEEEEQQAVFESREKEFFARLGHSP